MPSICGGFRIRPAKTVQAGSRLNDHAAGPRSIHAIIRVDPKSSQHLDRFFSVPADAKTERTTRFAGLDQSSHIRIGVAVWRKSWQPSRDVTSSYPSAY
jgi:hypothetical protein